MAGRALVINAERGEYPTPVTDGVLPPQPRGGPQTLLSSASCYQSCQGKCSAVKCWIEGCFTQTGERQSKISFHSGFIWGGVAGPRFFLIQLVGGQKIVHMWLPSPTKATSPEHGPPHPVFHVPEGTISTVSAVSLTVAPTYLNKVLILWILDFKLEVLLVDVLFWEFSFLISFLLPCPLPPLPLSPAS